MQCANTNECFEQLSAYFNGEKTGYFLIINTENYNIYREILQRLQADISKKCVYVSDNCFPNGLPDINAAVSKITDIGKYVLIGASQALMLQDNKNIEIKIDEILGLPIKGYAVILLDHCEQVLKKFMYRDIRVQDRVILVDGNFSELPQIKIVKNEKMCIESTLFSNFASLLYYLERMPEIQTENHFSATVVSQFSIDTFQNSIYPITEAVDIYDALASKYSDIAGATKKCYGSNDQWNWIADKIKTHSSFSSLVCNVFGATANLSFHISNVVNCNDKNRQWLLWLSMKVFGEANNKYLTLVINNSNAFDDFECHIYMDFVDIEISHPDFERYYSERKQLLEQFPENHLLILEFCNKLGRRQKNAVFYLTDRSNEEKYEFVRCLSIYEYTNEEINLAINSMSKSLYLYMKDFVFDSLNTKLPESDSSFRENLTEYFRTYKYQKLTNKIYPKFLETVNEYAVSRPYNKLQPRSSIISHMDKKNTQLFFFDALGVEYLSFIIAKCEEYGMVSEISIGRCELPSITAKNKEFLQYFNDNNCYKIDRLDEIKHHSQICNYQKCEYPIHLFEELDIIDEELRKIQSMLVQGTFEKALIVSDHGASRLAVRYDHEAAATIKLDESGEHSGRCCLSDENPMLPFAAYEDGFSVLANYERFKGGRRANVEVHGGASLEEVLVPIIALTKRPDNIKIEFVDSPIILKPRIMPEVTLYFNIPLHQPRLRINNEFYIGEFVADNKHAKFCLTKIKRHGDYIADIYDGDKNMCITLKLEVRRKTKEVDLF